MLRFREEIEIEIDVVKDLLERDASLSQEERWELCQVLTELVLELEGYEIRIDPSTYKSRA